jgi:hypothetical protein
VWLTHALPNERKIMAEARSSNIEESLAERVGFELTGDFVAGQ